MSEAPRPDLVKPTAFPGMVSVFRAMAVLDQAETEVPHLPLFMTMS